MLWLFLFLVAAPLAVLLLIWSGLRRPAAPYPPYPKRPDEPPAPAPWPDDLPAPVRRAFEAVLPHGPQNLTSAVVSGQAVLRINGLPLNARFRFIHEAGQSYRHQFDVTWFNLPVLHADESFVDGYGKMELGPLGTFEGTKTLEQSATLGLWAESIWLPSILITDPRLRWQAIDDRRARLYVPLADGEDQFIVTFNADTGRIASFDALRYRDADEDAVKLGWHCTIHEYGVFNDVLVPRVSSITWSDMSEPWAEWTVEEIVYNADVTEDLRA
jgi:hypothetical protein